MNTKKLGGERMEENKGNKTDKGEKENKIRLLKAEEIECRVSSVNEKGVSLLLYKDARVDQRILDETFGIYGWKRSHQCIDGNLYCTVEVYDRGKREWVSKQDVGTMALAEKEKSQASDSFKRACFNWGIGRELYSAPFIWVPAAKADVQRKGDKFYCNTRFTVRSIGYSSSREITGLTIVDGKGQVVYQMAVAGKEQEVEGKDGAGQSQSRDGNRESPSPRQVTNPGMISDTQMDSLKAELDRTGVAMAAVVERYKIGENGQISAEVYAKIMKALAKTRTAA